MAIEPAAANAPPPPANQQTPATTASRYYVLALLVLINVLSYVDRHMLPAFAAQITAELDLSRQQFGLLTGFAFVAVYALSGPVMGVLADRFNPSRVIAWGIALWSAMTWLTGLSRNFLQILLPRMAVGIGEATLHPAAAGILGQLFAPTQRATVFGLFFMGSHIGLGLAYWLAGTLGEAIGWRMMFMVLGAAGLVLALVLVTTARLKPQAFSPPVDPTRRGRQRCGVRWHGGANAVCIAVRGNAAFRQAVLGHFAAARDLCQRPVHAALAGHGKGPTGSDSLFSVRVRLPAVRHSGRHGRRLGRRLVHAPIPTPPTRCSSHWWARPLGPW